MQVEARVAGEEVEVDGRAFRLCFKECKDSENTTLDLAFFEL